MSKKSKLLVLPSWTSIPSCFNNSRNFCISSLSSLISLALASSLTIALHTICLALSAYLEQEKMSSLLMFFFCVNNIQNINFHINQYDYLRVESVSS